MENNEIREYEFNNSLATLKRIDTLLIAIYEVCIKNLPYERMIMLRVLLTEMRPFLSDEENKEVNQIGLSKRFELLDWLVSKGHKYQILMKKSDNPALAFQR